VASDLLEEDRDLDRSEAEAARIFGDCDAGPALLDHRGPERVVDAAACLDDGPHTSDRREPVEEITRTVSQRDLIVGQIEVYWWCRLAATSTAATLRA
jgi:hypothetical protein